LLPAFLASSIFLFSISSFSFAFFAFHSWNLSNVTGVPLVVSFDLSSSTYSSMVVSSSTFDFTISLFRT